MEGSLVDAWELIQDGWNKDEQSLAGKYPHMLTCNKPGIELKYKFTGSAIGLYWLVAPDWGDIEWCVDGSAPQRLSSWDKYALNSSRANYKILTDSLESKEHELCIKILADKNSQSIGTWIRIGAILLG